MKPGASINAVSVGSTHFKSEKHYKHRASEKIMPQTWIYKVATAIYYIV